jgi:hypothetical protein
LSLTAVLSWWFFSSFRLHPFFVGITDLNVDLRNSKSESCELKVKLFTDDFEAAFQKEMGVRLPNNFQSISRESEEGKALYPLLESFFQRNLSVNWWVLHLTHSKRQELPLELNQFQPSEESTQFTFTVKLPPKKWIALAKRTETIKIYNHLLMNYKNEQKHIIHCTWNGKRKSDYVDSKNPWFVWVF